MKLGTPRDEFGSPVHMGWDQPLTARQTPRGPVHRVFSRTTTLKSGTFVPSCRRREIEMQATDRVMQAITIMANLTPEKE